MPCKNHECEKLSRCTTYHLSETIEAGGLLLVENKLSYFANEDHLSKDKSSFAKN